MEGKKQRIAGLTPFSSNQQVAPVLWNECHGLFKQHGGSIYCEKRFAE